jgi:hypothetical protein
MNGRNWRFQVPIKLSNKEGKMVYCSIWPMPRGRPSVIVVLIPVLVIVILLARQGMDGASIAAVLAGVGLILDKARKWHQRRARRAPRGGAY